MHFCCGRESCGYELSTLGHDFISFSFRYSLYSLNVMVDIHREAQTFRIIDVNLPKGFSSEHKLCFQRCCNQPLWASWYPLRRPHDFPAQKRLQNIEKGQPKNDLKVEFYSPAHWHELVQHYLRFRLQLKLLQFHVGLAFLCQISYKIL